MSTLIKITSLKNIYNLAACKLWSLQKMIGVALCAQFILITQKYFIIYEKPLQFLFVVIYGFCEL